MLARFRIHVTSVRIPESGSTMQWSKQDIKALADDILERGQLEPIKVKNDGTLVSGWRRLAAMKLLKRDEIYCYVVH
jgi:ParB-like chromosome segregation protein Spo0J